jgi:phosphopentomutase
MTRAFIFVLDSLGVGGAPDAASFGDEGANTLAHIAKRCADGDADRAGSRSGALWTPHMRALGLGECCRAATGQAAPGLETQDWVVGSAGAAAEVSTGKDSQSGHWEIACSPVHFEWGYFPKITPCFPQTLIDALCTQANLEGILGNRHASGTQIIEELGDEHVRTGRPICYTSADSVFQIAAHEETFGLQRLYDICETARHMLDELRIGRVIARPFTSTPQGYARTSNRRDYGVPPPLPNLLSQAQAEDRDVISVGKIGDLFCHTATGTELKGHDNHAVFDQAMQAVSRLGNGGLMLVNLVDFDTLFGHRRDVAGYAGALEQFDERLPELLAQLQAEDLVIVTGDHGCDPTWSGSDHTRECVPVLAFGPSIAKRTLGKRPSFADMGATITRHLSLSNIGPGHSFLH